MISFDLDDSPGHKYAQDNNKWGKKYNVHYIIVHYFIVRNKAVYSYYLVTFGTKHILCQILISNKFRQREQKNAHKH